MPFFIKTILFFLFCLGICFPVFSWKEDLDKSLLPPRSICIKNLSALFKNSPVEIRSSAPDEACKADEFRYQFMFGKEPKNSIALIPKKTVKETFPPWVPSWPTNENNESPRLWHFSCLGSVEKQILGTIVKTYEFKGEITAPVKYQSCEAAYVMAQGACKEHLGGTDLYEECSGGNNPAIDWP